jgi:hypothetical protein
MLRRLSALAGFVFLCVCAASAAPSDAPATWLDRVNFYRATAALPPVAEDRSLSDAVLEHARYMVAHDEVKHSENPRARGATRAGAAAAALSNLAGSTSAFEPDAWAVDMWMQAPFHAIGILDPALAHVGFGIHRESDGRIQTAAGLDVLSGRTLTRRVAPYPIVWPADGAWVPLTAHTDEYPSPLTSCAGYRAPAGLPLIVQFGTGGNVPRVTGSWIAEEGRELDHCIFDETSYRNRDADQQRLGRAILASRNAIVLIPRRPLTPGVMYRAVVEVNGRLVDWTFGISQDRMTDAVVRFPVPILR